ncbi:hypothetical protein CAPTEDRAFT_228358 [Capitella teleta]|uniref:CAP-Gly domain-containing protein n=1 Tax=Capitella teleta TaxID=283909 RepID=R7VFT5_CAPTE|nr:hypothetical protein CAPTEDRAFT_228358 [Capitella teleta]|eukprot:ELU17489.1 hypothetical protein CAPTEDRAFT_228358 [Capitella teleta]
MVLFDNIAIGQRVEVLRGGRVFLGNVRFKGFLNSIPGEWVGVELDLKAGKHDGMMNGRRYFKCPAGHGIFTPSAKIRFVKMKRCLYNSYRSSPTVVDESLFSSKGYLTSTLPYQIYHGYVVLVLGNVSVTTQDVNASHSANQPDVLSDRPHFPLTHMVSNSIQAATLRKQQLQRSKCFAYQSSPIHVEYDVEYNQFITSPSIPKTHMPHAVQKKRVMSGWDRDHLPRDMTVNTARESVYYNTWNHL